MDVEISSSSPANRSIETDSYLRVAKRSEMLTHRQTFLDPGGDSLRLEKKVQHIADW